MSSGSPASHWSKPGAASRLFSAIARPKRSLAGKNASSSSTPMRVNGGVWICWMSATEIEVGAREPGGLEQLGEQDVLARLQRVGLDAGEAQQAGRRRLEPLAQQVAVLEDAPAAARRTT